MLARVITFAIDGVQPRQVWVEVDIRSGLPSFTIVGLGDTAVRESRDRIHAAILNSGFKFLDRRITANLAPASLRKAGPGFDAAIALALLAASEQVPAAALRQIAVFGELSLGGELRDSPGVLAVAEGARRAGLRATVRPAPAGSRGGARRRTPDRAGAESAEAAGVLRGQPIPPMPGPRAGRAAPIAAAGPGRRPRPRDPAAGARDRGRRRAQRADRGRARERARRCSPGGSRRSCRR